MNNSLIPRQADGKAQGSSIRQFLCSEAVFALGVHTTRAGSLVTSDSKVVRDVYYSRYPTKGPSYGHDESRGDAAYWWPSGSVWASAMESPDYLPLYNTFYLGNMRKKLGLLRKEEPEDEMLITELLQTMHNTGTDFTNTFRCLSQIPFPTSGDEEAEEGVIKMATDLFLEQCASLEELKAANKPSMDTRHRSPFSELTMLLHLAQSNPSLFQMVSERRTVSMKLGWPKELLEVEAKHRENWVTSYSKRLAGEVEGQRDVQALQEERVKVMNGTNPQYVLRNYIAQNARGSRERRLL